MRDIERKLLDQRDKFLDKLKEGKETITKSEILEMASSEDTHSWYDFDKLRYKIFKLAIARQWIELVNEESLSILRNSNNKYILEFLINYSLKKDSAAIKPERFVNPKESWLKDLSNYWDFVRYEIAELNEQKSIEKEITLQKDSASKNPTFFCAFPYSKRLDSADAKQQPEVVKYQRG